MCFKINDNTCLLEKINDRMQYLYELYVPLRERHDKPITNWKFIAIYYPHIIEKTEYFANDAKLMSMLGTWRARLFLV